MLALLGLAGCRSQSPSEATEQFCASLQTFDDAVEQLEQITADTTVRDAQRLRRDVDRAWRDVERSARNLAEAKTDAVSDAVKDLERTVNSISQRLTLLADGAASMRFSADSTGAGRAQAAEAILDGTWVTNDDATVSVTLDHLPDGTQWPR